MLSSMAGFQIIAFTVTGFLTGVVGSALTSKLRALGMRKLMRQEIGFFDIDTNTASELTAFLEEKVDKVDHVSKSQLLSRGHVSAFSTL